jgi:hypothetical protein
MKKMVFAAALALTLCGFSARPAHAWSKFNFSTGLNLGWETGGGTWSFGIRNQSEASNPGCAGPGCGYAPQAYPMPMQMQAPCAAPVSKSNVTPKDGAQMISYQNTQSAGASPASGGYYYYYYGYAYPNGYYYGN